MKKKNYFTSIVILNYFKFEINIFNLKAFLDEYHFWCSKVLVVKSEKSTKILKFVEILFFQEKKNVSIKIPFLLSKN